MQTFNIKDMIPEGFEDYDEDELEQAAKRIGLIERLTATSGVPIRSKTSGSFPQSQAPFQLLNTLNPNNRVIEAILQLVNTRRSEGNA